MVKIPLAEKLPDSRSEDNSFFIADYIAQSFNCLEKTLYNQDFKDAIISSSNKITNVIQDGGKVFIAGNGGSASDSQHFACELVSRFMIDSRPYPALSLTTDTSAITAISNDYGYEYIFSRQLRAFARSKDLFIAITTSGKSKNILKALSEAQKIGLFTCALTGSQGLANSAHADIYIQAQSSSTPHIQELHGIAIHLICGLVESNLQKLDSQK